jgi:hypothetical protein
VRNAAAIDAIGEVIAAGTTQFTAQCPRPLLHHPPVFGTFVRIIPGGASAPTQAANQFSATVDDPFAEPVTPVAGLPEGTPDETLYGVVYSAGTGSAEPGRRPTAYGLAEEQLRQEQPQIFDLLATEFSALHIGYARNGRFSAGIPPRPPRLHAAVSGCTPPEVRAITESPELLRALIKSPGDVPTDELILACIRYGFACRDEEYAYLVRAGKQLATLLRDDPDRLTAILGRLELYLSTAPVNLPVTSR